MITITYNGGRTIDVPVGVSYKAVADRIQGEFDHRIVLVKSENKLKELNKICKGSETIEFITTAKRDGMLTYERSSLMLLCTAIHDVADDESAKVIVMFSVINGYYVELRGNISLDEAFAKKVRDRMRELVEEDVPLKKSTVANDVARAYFREKGMPNRDKLFRYRRHSGVNVYAINDYVDYYYGYMVPSTGYLQYFDIVTYENGLALLLPTQNQPELVAPLEPQNKIFKTMQTSTLWAETMGIGTVGEINDHYARAAIAQLGECHYLLVTLNHEDLYGPITGKAEKVAKVLCDLGVQKAYTLDGGQTASMIVDGELINSVEFGYQRAVSDIIYFATALPERQKWEAEHG